MSKKTVYDIITDRLISQIETSRKEGNTSIPWIKPWQNARRVGMPRNLKSQSNYNGINLMLLYSTPWDNPNFLTFKQAKEIGATVKKGEKSCPVIFFTWYETGKTNKKGEKEQAPCLKYYNVFNVEQCKNVPSKYLEVNKIDYTPNEFNDIKDAKKLLEKMSTRINKGALVLPPIEHVEGNKAYYNSRLDKIVMPTKPQFKTSAHYYSTLFHELTHSTGHKEKLNRTTLTDAHYFGDNNYSKEELVAEMGSAFLCGMSGIDMNEIRANNAAYLDNWLKAIKANPKLLIHSASQARKAVHFLTGKEI